MYENINETFDPEKEEEEEEEEKEPLQWNCERACPRLWELNLDLSSRANVCEGQLGRI